MHFAWQFSVSFTCAASGRIFAGKNFGEKLLPSHTRVKYNPENDIQHSSDGPATYKSQQFPKRPAKIIQPAPNPRNALPPRCAITLHFRCCVGVKRLQPIPNAAS